MISALGLMSGTSLDGVDVAWIKTDGEGHINTGPSLHLPYTPEDQNLLREALIHARDLTQRDERPPLIARAEALIDQRHIEAVEAFRAAYPALEIELIGYHGQTILHRPEARLTVQIGRGQVLADALDCPVLFDMRAADVAAGGQGAPLVPVYHRALARAAGLRFPVGILNIGGVANLTYLPSAEAEPLACDTGPGNALLDDLMLEQTGEPMDRDGATAARGQVNAAALAQLLDDSFFELMPPKSLDRNRFSRHAVAGLALSDAAATLTAFTSAAVKQLLRQLPDSMSELVVCGGGARNPTLIQFLEKDLQCPVKTAEFYGWSGDALEAQAFAYLAVRAKKGKVLTFPTTTGCPAPMSGGVLVRPRG